MLVHPTAGSDVFSPELYQRAADLCLRAVRAPLRWIPSLARFMQEHTIVVSPTEPERHLDVWEERIGGCVASHCYARRVWDFATGREIIAEEVSPREQVYADDVRAAEDLHLDTRWVEWWRSTETHWAALVELAKRVETFEDERLLALQVRTEADGIVLTHEVRLEWHLAQLDRVEWRHAEVERLVETITERLRPSASRRDIRARLEQLRQERG